MSKRSREEIDPPQPQKKARTGFSVGPANLPDGTYKRKTQKIKTDLIQKAKVRKAYAKIKAKEEERNDEQQSRYNPYLIENGSLQNATMTSESVHHSQDNRGIHPDRQAMLNEPEVEAQSSVYPNHRRRNANSRGGRNSKTPGESLQRKRKPDRYQKDFAEAEERKYLIEAQNKRREVREQDRRAMAKARKPGKDGKQKLGRQSKVLLDRVKRLAG